MSRTATMSVTAMRNRYPKWDVPLTGEVWARYRASECSVSVVYRARLSEYLDDLLERVAQFKIDPDYLLLSKDELKRLAWHITTRMTNPAKSDRPRYVNHTTGNLITLAYEEYATLIFLYRPKDNAHE